MSAFTSVLFPRLSSPATITDGMDFGWRPNWLLSSSAILCRPSRARRSRVCFSQASVSLSSARSSADAPSTCSGTAGALGATTASGTSGSVVTAVLIDVAADVGADVGAEVVAEVVTGFSLVSAMDSGCGRRRERCGKVRVEPGLAGERRELGLVCEGEGDRDHVTGPG